MSALTAGRVGALALINLGFLYVGMHLSFVADLLRVPLRKYRAFHRAVGWMVTILSVVHIAAAADVNQTTFQLHIADNLFGLIGAVSLGVLSLLFLPFPRSLAYEIFLRVHQAVAALCAYAIWAHLPTHSISPRFYLYITCGVLILISCLQFVIFLYHNGAFASRGHPRALITRVSSSGGNAEKLIKGQRGDDVDKLIKIRVTLPRPMKIHAGQYVNLWILSASWWSWAQSHPFTVVSWSKGKQEVLDLVVQPRRGLTADLVRLTEVETGASFSLPAFVSGPHGMYESIDRYETALMVASGSGVVAVIPHLKQLIHGYNTSTSRTRRVHFVWQLHSLDAAITIAMEEWLNDLLDEDILVDGYILTISIYLESGKMAKDEMLFGNHKRAVIYKGPADLRKIVQTELFDQHTEHHRNGDEERGDMLVMASASNKMRDELRSIIREYRHEKVKISELEFQPEL